jgi:hypothetical protein
MQRGIIAIRNLENFTDSSRKSQGYGINTTEGRSIPIEFREAKKICRDIAER